MGVTNDDWSYDIGRNSLKCYKISELDPRIRGSTEAICRFAEYLLSRPLERRYMHNFTDLWVLVVHDSGTWDEKYSKDSATFWKGVLSSEQHAFFEKNGKMVVAYMLISEFKDDVEYLIEWQDSLIRGFGLAEKLVDDVREQLRYNTYEDGECKDVVLHSREIIFPAAGYHFKLKIESVFEDMYVTEDILKPFYQDEYGDYDIEGLIEFFSFRINPKRTDWRELGDWIQWILNWKSVLTDETPEEETYPHPFKNLPERYINYSFPNLFALYAKGSFQTPEDITKFVERALDRLHSVYKLFGIIRLRPGDYDDDDDDDCPWDKADIASADKICEIVRRNTAEHVQAFHKEHCT